MGSANDTVFRRIYLRYGQLECIYGVSVLLVQRPGDAFIEVLDRVLCFLRNMAHNRVYHLTLIVSLLALDDILWRDPTLRKIDITCNPALSVQFL